jgi:hypothetical protein
LSGGWSGEAMNVYEILAIFDISAKRIEQGYYPFLKLLPERISEADARHVITKVLEERGFIYGLELKTKTKFPMLEKGQERSALIDLGIYDTKRDDQPSIWVEFKRGQPGDDMIIKDFIKMIIEPEVDIACFFHVLPKPRVQRKKHSLRPLTAIFLKYNNACKKALEKINGMQDDSRKRQPKGFMLYVHDLENRKKYIVFKADICSIVSLEKPKLEVIWEETTKIKGGFGHGVEFLFSDKKGTSERVPIAIIEGYEWLHNTAATTVRVKIQPETAEVFQQFKAKRKDILEETRFAVLTFFDREDKYGYITENISTCFNA